MTRAALIQTSMRGGEISRAVRARHDIGAYPDGLELCQNALVRTAGPADKRGGFVRLGAARSAAGKAWWLVWRKSSREVVRIEICGGYLRFWDGITRTLITSSGDPVEIACPWPEDDIPGLRICQSADVMWIAHVSAQYPLKVLRRTGPAAFTLADYACEEGPFLSRRGGVTLTFSAVSGSVAVASSQPVFEAGHVGALLRVEAVTFDGVSSWSFDASWVLNEHARHGNNIYSAGGWPSGTRKSGNAPPLHTEGAAWDGSVEKVRWTHQGFTHGLLRITAFTNASSVQADVLDRLPFYGSTPLSSHVWQLGAFCPSHGYPRAVTLHEERLILGGSAVEPDSVYGSTVAGYGPTSASFRPSAITEQIDSDALKRTLADGEVNPIVWMLSIDTLVVGTEGKVKRIAPPSPDEAITPAGANGRTIVDIPCSEMVRPVTTATSFIYVPMHETELIEVQRDQNVEPRNLAELAEHMVAAGVRSMAWCRKPSNALFVLDEDGYLSSLTYSPENQVVAWSRHVIGGELAGEPPEIDDICAAPGPYRGEELWAFVRRTIDGVTIRSVEYMERVFSPRRMRREDACCVDGAGYFDQWNANPAHTVTFTPDAPDAPDGLLQASGHAPFLEAHVGRTVFLRSVRPTPRRSDQAGPMRLKIVGYVNATTVQVLSAGEYPAGWAGAPFWQWAFAVTQLSGLSWLEGRPVKVNGDGNDYGGRSPLVVTGGAVALPEPVARGWVGEAYDMHLISLPLNDGEASGAGRGALKRIDRGFVMIDGAAAGMVRRRGVLEAGIDIAGRDVSHFMGATPPVAENDVWEELPGGFDRDGQLEFINGTALPSGIAGWVMRTTTNA